MGHCQRAARGHALICNLIFGTVVRVDLLPARGLYQHVAMGLAWISPLMPRIVGRAPYP